MARKKNIDSALLKRFERKETKRSQDTRSKRRYYLIVCEGEKTEPFYFEGLRTQLPPHVIELVQLEVKGTGRNTLGVIEVALREKVAIEKQPGRVVDEVQAIKRAKRLEEQFVGRTDYANHNPCTRVHVLVEKLLFPDTSSK